MLVIQIDQLVTVDAGQANVVQHVDGLGYKPNGSIAESELAAARVLAAKADVIEVIAAVVKGRVDWIQHVLGGSTATRVSANPGAILIRLARRHMHRDFTHHQRV